MAKINKVNMNYNYDRMVKLMENLIIRHGSTELGMLKNELNKLFTGAKCIEVLYTNNTDKLFFGMRVYPFISAEDAIKIMTEDATVVFGKYYLEIDSKLTDPMMCLTGREMTAILLHEVGHIVNDFGTVDAVRKQVDVYFANSGESLNITDSVSYKELLAYALKDSIMKTASIFNKFGNSEMMADSFVVSCGFGPDLESGFRKLTTSAAYINKDVDNRFIVMSWVLRLHGEVKIKRLPAIRTLNKAKTLTASQLEKRELNAAVNSLNHLEENLSESVMSDLKLRLVKKLEKFKAKGIRGIRDDIYEMNLRLRTVESEEDALYIIRMANTNIAILQDYVTEPQLTEDERNAVYESIQELYTIRQKAAKESNIREKYGSMIQVVYPTLK